MTPNITKRLDAIAALILPREPLHITITHYLADDSEPLRRLHGLPHSLASWPPEILAMLTPLSVREVVV